MPKSREHYEHGLHNEEACNILHLSGKFPDWTITTAFYAALHFVEYKIFPFTKRIGTEDKRFESFNEWYGHKRWTGDNRHEIMKDLVAEHCPIIHPEYDWLLGESMAARYRHYQFQPEIVNRALSNLQKIKKFCAPSD